MAQLYSLTLCLFFASFFLIASLLNPVKAVSSRMDATWIENGEARELRMVVDQLDPGRYRIATANSNGSLLLTFEADEKLNPTDYLMIRKGYHFRSLGKTAENLTISFQPQKTIELKPSFSPTLSLREIFPLGQLDSDKLSVKIDSTEENKEAHFVIEEIGLYKQHPNRFPFLAPGKLKWIAKGLCMAAGLFGIFLLAKLERRKAKFLGTIFIFALGLATFSSALFVKFSPEWSRDLKSSFASDTLNSAFENYHIPNYGLYMANSILEGKGPLLHGVPPWYKMPGYGYLLAIVGGKASYLIENLLKFAVRGVFLQILLFISGLAFLFWASTQILSPVAAGASAFGILLLPSWMIFRLNIEGIMPAVALFCLGGSCLFLDQYRKQGGCFFSWRYHLLFHAGFALWFFLRTDVLPAWALISALLYCRKLHTLKYLILPICLFLTIALPWASFKKSYTGTFSLTTESVGASLMGGLWEVPNKFIWTHSDSSFLKWIDSVGLKCEIGPTGIKSPTKSISDFAMKESLLFCCTYPIYIASLVWHKFIEFVNYDRMAIPIMFLLTALLIAIFAKYKRMQVLLLSWIVLFNMPIFFLFFTDGCRFIAPTFISLVFAGCSLLFDKDFYSHFLQSKKLVSGILVFSIGIVLFGKSLDAFFIRHDEWRYWAPFLDPARSTFNIVKSEEF